MANETAAKVKPTVKIKVIDDYGFFLFGAAYGHPRFPDGATVRTSLIVRREGNTAETLNTMYELLPDDDEQE